MHGIINTTSYSIYYSKQVLLTVKIYNRNQYIFFFTVTEIKYFHLCFSCSLKCYYFMELSDNVNVVLESMVNKWKDMCKAKKIKYVNE